MQSMAACKRLSSTRGGRLQPHLFHQGGVRVTVGDETMLLLFGTYEVAHLEIDVGGEPGLVVAQRGKLFLHRDPVVPRKLGGLRRPWRLDRAAALHQVR